MWLEGSCHCGAVRFRARSRHPYPYNLCYCSICRKTAGGGGFAINLRADSDTLEVEGGEHTGVYRADTGDGPSEARRHFCRHCASALWVHDPRWPEMIHPFASAVDTPLPAPPERVHLMLESKAPWVEPCVGPRDRTYAGYPEESIEAWHRRAGLIDDE